MLALLTIPPVPVPRKISNEINCWKSEDYLYLPTIGSIAADAGASSQTESLNISSLEAGDAISLLLSESLSFLSWVV